MFTVNRWWERYGVQMSLVLLAVGGAWTLRQTQGAALTEVYQVISRPFQVSPVKAERLSDARTLELQTRLQEVENQNIKLKELLGYVGQAKVKGAVVSPIIGRSADQWWQQFTLGRGSSQGIKEGDIVNAPGGLVGRIVSVTNNTSRVLLVSDPSSQLGVTISRTRNMGFLRGDSRSRAVMQFFDKVPDVKPGDVIATSPYSQMFPAGLPVGRVESVDMKKTPAPVAVIELSAPMDYLEWVVVSPKTENPK